MKDIRNIQQEVDKKDDLKETETFYKVNILFEEIKHYVLRLSDM